MAVPPRPAAPSSALQRAAGVLADRLAAATGAWGRRVVVDGAAVLTERARFRGLQPRGRWSHGGSAQLLPIADGWAAVSLSRPSDLELVPAWRGLLGFEEGSGDPWPDVAEAVRASTGTELAATAELLGLAVGVLGERSPEPGGGVTATSFGPGPERTDGRLRVLDLSALWAGPLCAHLLGRADAAVTKVESPDRRDGARLGDPELHQHLNSSKQTVLVDLRTGAGRRALDDLVGISDLVVTAARRRALDAMGVVPEEWLQRVGGPSVWVSITGHGLGSARVAFGDDAAVAGGLVGEDAEGPTFLGDAVADPLAGLLAATRAAEAVATGHRILLDVSMAAAAAAVAAAAP